MANPYPTSNRALVRYEFTKAVDGATKGSQRHEEFELDPPTHSIAEVEKRFRDANTDTGKEFIDADLLPVKEDVPAEPVLANRTIPAPGTPKDPQIVRERAAGREQLPSTVTEDADAEPDGTIRAVGDGSDDTHFGDENLPLSAFDNQTDEQVLAHKGIGDATLKRIRKAQKKRDAAK